MKVSYFYIDRTSGMVAAVGEDTVLRRNAVKLLNNEMLVGMLRKLTRNNKICITEYGEVRYLRSKKNARRAR